MIHEDKLQFINIIFTALLFGLFVCDCLSIYDENTLAPCTNMKKGNAAVFLRSNAQQHPCYLYIYLFIFL